MNRKRRALFSNLKFENWKNLILFAIICCNFVYFVASFWHSDIGVDYFAFWSVGKIADEKGYSEIYDLNNLRSVQAQELKELDLSVNSDDHLFSPIPVPYFSFFVLPFQFLSKVSLVHGYWLWTFSTWLF